MRKESSYRKTDLLQRVAEPRKEDSETSSQTALCWHSVSFKELHHCSITSLWVKDPEDGNASSSSVRPASRILTTGVADLLTRYQTRPAIRDRVPMTPFG